MVELVRVNPEHVQWWVKRDRDGGTAACAALTRAICDQLAGMHGVRRPARRWDVVRDEDQAVLGRLVRADGVPWCAERAATITPGSYAALCRTYVAKPNVYFECAHPDDVVAATIILS